MSRRSVVSSWLWSGTPVPALTAAATVLASTCVSLPADGLSTMRGSPSAARGRRDLRGRRAGMPRSGNQARPSFIAEVGRGPLDHHQQPVFESYKEQQMDQKPGEPGWKAR